MSVDDLTIPEFPYGERGDTIETSTDEIDIELHNYHCNCYDCYIVKNGINPDEEFDDDCLVDDYSYDEDYDDPREFRYYD